MIDAVSIGKNIKGVRKEIGLKQREVAEKASLSISQLSSYENGKSMPGLPTLGNIAIALNTSLDRLYFGAPSEAFLNASEDFGETVVNCFLKLRELGVVNNINHDICSSDGTADLPICSYELKRLFSELREYEHRKEFYSDGDAYVKQVKESVANEINKRTPKRRS